MLNILTFEWSFLSVGTQTEVKNKVEIASNQFFKSSRATFSTWMVWGNISTGCTAVMSYFSESIF